MIDVSTCMSEFSSFEKIFLTVQETDFILHMLFFDMMQVVQYTEHCTGRNSLETEQHAYFQVGLNQRINQRTICNTCIL